MKQRSKTINIIISFILVVLTIMTYMNYKYMIKLFEEDKVQKDEQHTENIDDSFDSAVAIYVQDNNSIYYDILNYSVSSVIPSSGYAINNNFSFCTVNDVIDNNIVINYNNGKISFSNLKLGTKCYLYFIKLIDVPSVMANASLGKRTDGWVSYSTNGSTKNYTAGVYETDDTDDGSTVYYYSGDVKNNWLRFGDNGSGTCYYWRIIRTNTAAEGGGIRLLYAGSSTSCSGSVPVMTNAYINSSTQYNSSYNNSSYVGYMFTAGEQHGHGTSSTVKQAVDSWYTSSGLSNFASYINDNAIYCNDRTTPGAGVLDIDGNSIGDYGTWRATGTRFSYAATYRAGYYYNSSGTNKKNTTVISPTLECSNSEDKFSKGTAAGGNGYLTAPLALMTSDELLYAGAKYGSNSYSYYYYASNNSSSATASSIWWTMSPIHWDGSVVYAFAGVSSLPGRLGGYGGGSHAVRPVVSLKSSISMFGSGTVNDPYVVK